MSTPLQISPQMMDMLCPMHLVLDRDGTITHAAPTVAKLFGGQALEARRFLELFRVCRPRRVQCHTDLVNMVETRLHLQTRNRHETELKGKMVPLVASGGHLINLSFGISILDAVRDYDLTNRDFAATDLAIEMLYLVEAKSAAMEASRKLNMRLQGAKIAAEEQAFTDTLTGLKNRRAIEHVLRRLIKGNKGFALMHVDLDYFKTVNDTLGHAAGDLVLQTVARAMVEETRDTDTVGRIGGDEFTIVLPGIPDPKTLERVGRRIIDRLEEPISFKDQICRVSGSVGTVWIDEGDSPTMEKLMEQADKALYASKHAGRGRQTLYTSDIRSRSSLTDHRGARDAVPTRRKGDVASGGDVSP